MTTRFTVNAASRRWPLGLVLVILFRLGLSAQAQGSVTSTQSFSYTGQIVTWTVPIGVASLTIEARGAEGGGVVGGNASAGKGAIVAAQVSVTPGQSLSILVGQSLNGKAAGGGGSFVVAPPSTTTAPTPLVIAGGGGGAGYDDSPATKHGQVSPTGGNGGNSGTGGGSGGAGGRGGDIGGGGGGLFGDGGDGSSLGRGGKAFVHGGAGGIGANAGSFGGGGSDYGGGGGYSGGGGGGVGGVGGGGGSFTAGSRLFARTGAIEGNSGNGLVIISYPSPPQPIRYVKATASGTGDGSSWANASSDLQTMIDADGVQQVWVAGGRYTPARSVRSFIMKNNVVIYGGFSGSETELSQRPGVNPVVGQVSSTTLTTESGSGTSVIRNNSSVLDQTAGLNGIVITGGDAVDGGGFVNFNSSPTLTNCVISGNSAGRNGNGGAFYNSRGSNPTLINCLISNNFASLDGGGLLQHQ